MAKFGDIGEFRTGGTPSSSHPEYYGTDYPWITTVALGSTYIDSSDATAFLSDVGLINSSTKVIDAGSLMIGIRVGVGKCSINNVPMCTSQDIVSVVGIDKEKYYLPFLVAFVNSKKDYFDAQKRGATIKGITTALIKDLVIPDLSYEKQQEISTVLEGLQLLIEQHKEMLVRFDQLLKSRFIEMFGDIQVEDSLEHLCHFIDYRGKTPEKAESGLPFITAKNVRMHYMSFDTQEFISKETYDRVMTRGFPKVGDVVFTTEAPLGNACRIPFIDTEFYIGQRIITMQTDILEPAYLEYALASESFKKKIAKKSSGSTVTGIRSKLLEKLTIPVPPKELQERFATFVAQTDKSKVEIQKALDELEILKKSLMQQYFG